jgi:hypothetical protein
MPKEGFSGSGLEKAFPNPVFIVSKRKVRKVIMHGEKLLFSPLSPIIHPMLVFVD